MVDGRSPLLEQIRSQKGILVHANGPVPGGWRVTEVWDPQADFEAWLEAPVERVRAAFDPRDRHFEAVGPSVA